MVQGKVLNIFITDKASAPMKQVSEIKAIKSTGLEGDRYATGKGFYPKTKDKIRDVTLISIEGIKAANKELADSFAPIETRRNILTKGVDLNFLVGKEFSVGKVKLKGTALCTPCKHPEEVTGKQGFNKSFEDRGGIRAEILNSGTIAEGAEISL